ncbi:MAG TPA: hypothetical protein VK898_19680, partial [Chloroflexota bacterium]|nr:hypothetical protein [Chloroflexota bacterium]
MQIDRFQQLQGVRRQEANADAFRQYGNQPTAANDVARWHQVAVVLQNDSKAIARDQHLFATCPATGDHQCLGAQTLFPICSPSAQPRSCSTARGQPGWYSPEADPQYPNRYHVAVQRESYLLSARRDAANQKADAAENRFIHFTAALTLFAVAVFLFGYSLTPQGQKRRRLFTRAAAGFVVAGGIWALVHAINGSPSAPAAAATAYADGEVALNDSDYATAAKNLARAAKLRPEFVDAWSDLASAKYVGGFSPAVSALSNSESTQVATVPALKEAIEADRHAVEAGSQSPTVRFELGADLLYLGLLTHNRDQVAESRSLSADAANRFEAQLRDGRHPGNYLLNSEFNVAEADLANGSPAAATDYRHAEQRMVQLGQDLGLESVVASPITDLNLIAQTLPKLSQRAQALTEGIIARVSRTNAWNFTPGGQVQSGHDIAHFTGVKIVPDPGHMQYTIAKAQGFDRDHDLVSAQWEYRNPANGNWEVLPDISGPAQPASTSGNLSDNSNGSYFSENPSFL